jgi:ABC-type uncharacterized transport system substrate-binding protein
MRAAGHFIAFAWFLIASGLFANQSHAAQVVWLALSGQGGPYDETVESIRSDLQRNGTQIELEVRPWQEFARLDGRPPRLVVTIGVSAMRGLLNSGLRAPLLATLVPRTAYASLARSGLQHSAVWLDQPAERQFELLRLALPSRQRVAVVFGPESRIQEEEILRAARERKLTVFSARTTGSDQMWTALQPVIDGTDVLLALADPQVYNGGTVHTVLTTTYRRGIPVIAFSQAFARAGALLALYSTPAQIGSQVGAIIRATLAGQPLPPPQGPREFSIGVNTNVAHSFGIQLDSNLAATWAEQIRTKERTQ